MEAIAVRRFDEFLTLIARLDLAPDLLDARARSFEAVYEAHYRDVSRHVILTTRGRDDVEEIVAETFARAFAAWRSGHGPAGRPLPWLLVIARRIATDRWRRRRFIAWLPLPDSEADGRRLGWQACDRGRTRRPGPRCRRGRVLALARRSEPGAAHSPARRHLPSIPARPDATKTSARSSACRPPGFGRSLLARSTGFGSIRSSGHEPGRSRPDPSRASSGDLAAVESLHPGATSVASGGRSGRPTRPRPSRRRTGATRASRAALVAWGSCSRSAPSSSCCLPTDWLGGGGRPLASRPNPSPARPRRATAGPT